MSDEDEVWYDKILTAFRIHQEREHLDKGFTEIQNEIRYFEESLYYEEFKDGFEHDWPCCWVDCKWRIQFKTMIKLDSMEVKE